MSLHKHDRADLTWWLYALDKAHAIVAAVTGSFLLYTRSPSVAYFVAGALACMYTVSIVKSYVRQPRPLLAYGNERRKKTYGMPSTHSAAITYYAAYICLASAHLPIHRSLSVLALPVYPLLARVLPITLCVPAAATIAMSRIWLGHHTWPQVGAGCVYGLCFALGWFRLWTSRLIGHRFEEMVRMYST